MGLLGVFFKVLGNNFSFSFSFSSTLTSSGPYNHGRVDTKLAKALSQKERGLAVV